MQRYVHGFTLIELLVSVGIIALLLSFSLSGINSARSRSRDAKRIADLQTLQAGLEQYALGDSSHTYPPMLGAATAGYCPQDIRALALKGGLYGDPCFTIYLAIVPFDPAGQNYVYRRPACFTNTPAVPGGVTLTNAPVASCVGLLSSSSYGLHTVLESANNRDAIRDATPTRPFSYDLIP